MVPQLGGWWLRQTTPSNYTYHNRQDFHLRDPSIHGSVMYVKVMFHLVEGCRCRAAKQPDSRASGTASSLGQPRPWDSRPSETAVSLGHTCLWASLASGTAPVQKGLRVPGWHCPSRSHLLASQKPHQSNQKHSNTQRVPFSHHRHSNTVHRVKPVEIRDTEHYSPCYNTGMKFL